MTEKEMKEIKKTHTNIFDCVGRGKEKIEEKDKFESRLEALDIRLIEYDRLEKEERLQRVRRKQMEWEAQKI